LQNNFMARKSIRSFNPMTFLNKINGGKTHLSVDKKHVLFSQGDAADAAFYLEAGRVKLTVLSKDGKEGVIAILGPGAFFGEGCLTMQRVRMSTATAIENAKIVRIEKKEMIRVLHDDPEFSAHFTAYLLSRNIRIEADLVDHLFNSSEKRLARVLLLLAHFGKEGREEPILPKISQETLADMIGTTRSRVSFFLNKFRKMGFIEYNGDFKIHSSLLNIILHD